MCAAATLATGLPVTATPAGQAAAAPHRGELVSVTPIDDLNRAEVIDYLRQAGMDTSRVRTGVRAYRVVYRTITARGARPTTASELVALPRNGRRTLDQVAWLHGTTVYRGDVASMNPGGSDRPIAFTFAAAGYAVSAPDYLGLGSGPGFHPYNHIRSTVTASVDALRATRTLVGSRGGRLDGRVLVTGHSQGGPATMALGEALQRGAIARLRPGMLAPISGPFHFGRSLRTATTGGVANATAYLAYLSTAWNRLYGLYATPGEAFRAPYRETVPPLFDGRHSAEQIFRRLPSTPDELFTRPFLSRLRQPDGALRHAVRQASATCDWRPGVPVTLYTATGDRDVPIWNSRYCRRALLERAADARLVDLGDVDHGTSARLGVPRALRLFDRLTGR